MSSSPNGFFGGAGLCGWGAWSNSAVSTRRMNSARQPLSSAPFAARARLTTASNDAEPLWAESFMSSANSTTAEANRNDSVGSAGVMSFATTGWSIRVLVSASGSL